MSGDRLLTFLTALLSVDLINGGIVPEARMNFGNAVETLSRFPHHVLIEDFNNYVVNYSDGHYCGGSIISERWILTAASCIYDIEVLHISFQRSYLRSLRDSYSMIINSDAVYVYPTYFDDVALIRLPASIIFTATVQPVQIYPKKGIASVQFAVMPGFNNISSDTNEPSERSLTETLDTLSPLVYGMFDIASMETCKREIGSDFDEYLHYCTKPWITSQNHPTVVDVGSGLLLDWPVEPRLVGIYSSSSPKGFAIYTNVAKYESWIRGVMKEADN